MSTRKKIVAGNWKMNTTYQDGLQLALDVNAALQELDQVNATVIVSPPFIHLSAVGQLVHANDHLKVAAQNCAAYDSGAYTGEISADMVVSTGAEYVIIGHSERREHFQETSKILATKLDKALAAGLTPIFCCGEPLEIREEGSHEEYVCSQLTESLYHLSEDQFAKLIIAYEPIWAIGTGKTASAQQAQDMHAALRKHLVNKYPAANQTAILYGGSVKAANANEIFSQTDVDGGLVGGASLKAEEFVKIVAAC